MNSAEVLIKFKGDTSSADKATNEVGTSLTKLTKAFTFGNIISTGVSKGLGILTSNLDSAISRVDTLNNFPKVMSNLGISAEDSEEVISDLSKKLQGLPTSIDSAAMAVQRFTSKNGNVKDSEKIFLAVNNAILAGGANADIQASALEQLSQAYAKGKPDMMEWRTLMTAMPAQLKQVATAMGYVDADALGKALREGDASMDDFMNTMMRMNTEGVNGFKSFEDQARNATGGIQTNIKNMKTAFVRGIADIIKKIDDALEPVGGLSGVITSMGKIGEKVFKKLGSILATVIKAFVKLGQWINKNKAWIIPLTVAVATFIATFKTIKTVITIIKSVKAAMVLLNATLMTNHIALIVAAIAALVAAFIYLWNNCEAFRKFWQGLWENIKKAVGIVIEAIKKPIELFASFLSAEIKIIKDIIQSIIDFVLAIPQKIIDLINTIVKTITTFVTKTIPDFIKNLFTTIGNWLTNFVTKTIPNFISKVVSFFTSLPGKIFNAVKSAPGKIKDAFVNGLNTVKEGAQKIFDKVVDTLKELPKKMVEIGKDLVKGLWEGIKSMGDWIGKKVGGFGGGLVKGLKKVFGIHSPSVVMEKEVGVNLGLGLVNGIEDTTNKINKAIRNVSSGIVADAGINLSNSTMATMNNNSGNQVINVYASFKQDSLGQTVRNIKTFSGGARNDYNYGVGV